MYTGAKVLYIVQVHYRMGTGNSGNFQQKIMVSRGREYLETHYSAKQSGPFILFDHYIIQ